MNMSEYGEIRNQNIIASDESDPSSPESRISNDSGIEDLDEDMTVLTNKEESFPQKLPPCSDEKISHSPKQLNSTNSITNDFTAKEYFLPLAPEYYQSGVPEEHKDVLDDSAINGICGLYNLGNTCFMNSTLQCLFATKTIRTLVLQGDVLLNGIDHTHDSSTLFLFFERLQELCKKVFSGQYSLLYPDQFHAALRRYHPLFCDYKQHDSQEFLSFLLNTLHEILTHTSQKNQLCKTSNQSVNYSPSREDYTEKITGDVSKRLKMDNTLELLNASMEVETDAGVECEDNSTKSEKAWREHMCNNQSVIADSFQGQFQSVITCEKCSCVSTMYEPFMFLSLPIPHAMEKQIVITWVPSVSSCALPGMVTVKNYLVIVNKNGIINDVKHEFFKMVKKDYINENDVVFAEVQNSSSVRILDGRTQLNYLSKSKQVYAFETLTTRQHNDISIDKYKTQDITSQVANTDTEHKSYKPEVSGDDTEQKSNTTEVNCASAWHSCSICLEETFDEEMKMHIICGGFLCNGCLSTTAQFHKHQSFPCPICNRYINIDDYKPLVNPDSVKSADETNLRQVLVPVMFRKDVTSSKKYNVFGHPQMCLLLSKTQTEVLVELMKEILISLSRSDISYDILITDGTGLSCGRCEMLSSCTGCRVTDHEVLQLKPGSCITINFNDNLEVVSKVLNLCHVDKSMLLKRDTDVVKLDECIEKFADMEILTEDNPWFCPQCKTNQIATKNMSVTRWPDTLIIHLKRFYFEGSQGCKITCPVDYPFTNLNIDSMTCVDNNINENTKTNYNLNAAICHTGSLYSGHYTAFCKSKEEWYYFNDESFKLITPSDAYQSESYVLFYEKQS